MADFIQSPNTGASLAAMDADGVRKLWHKKVYVHEQEEDFYAQLEGARPDSIIETRTDTSVGAGQTLNFTAMAGFYQEGVHGDDNFNTPADYEKIVVKTNHLKVDWIRNACRHNERMEELFGLRHEIVTKVPDEFGKWLGRKKTRATEMKAIRTALKDAYNFVCAGGGTDIHALGGGNSVGWSDIVDTGTIMQSHGAAPAYLGKVGKNPIKRFVFVSPHNALRSLKTDEMYLQAQTEAGVDGTANVLFTGGFSDVDGHMILSRPVIDHDGDGPLGAPCAPKLRLHAGIAPGTTGFTMTGGANTKVLYTQDFPNHAFKYNESDAENTDTTPFYVLVVNPPNAPTDPGKMGFYKCVGNDGKAITVTERLGSAASGDRATTVGSVQWNTGKWAGKHTETHPAGAMAYLANAKGQPIGYSLLLGACGMRRGYGKYRGQRFSDSKEGGFVQESYVATVFGVGLKANVKLQYPNFMVLAHSIHYAGTPIPTDL
jgi:hypothetical protein